MLEVFASQGFRSPRIGFGRESSSTQNYGWVLKDNARISSGGKYSLDDWQYYANADDRCLFTRKGLLWVRYRAAVTTAVCNNYLHSIGLIPYQRTKLWSVHIVSSPMKRGDKQAASTTSMGTGVAATRFFLGREPPLSAPFFLWMLFSRLPLQSPAPQITVTHRLRFEFGGFKSAT